MISDQQRIGQRDALWNRLSDSSTARIERATVKLHGGQFTGSGVILGVGIEGGRGRMVVATAAHNLRVQIDGLTGKARTDFWGGGAQPWSLQEMTQRQQSMIAAFCRDVSIHYDAADMTVDDPTAEAGVATIHTVKMGAFTYDACLLFADFAMDRRPRCEIITT